MGAESETVCLCCCNMSRVAGNSFDGIKTKEKDNCSELVGQPLTLGGEYVVTHESPKTRSISTEHIDRTLTLFNYLFCFVLFLFCMDVGIK